MKKDYDRKLPYVVKADEIEKNFDADGVAKLSFFQACMMVESAASNTF